MKFTNLLKITAIAAVVAAVATSAQAAPLDINAICREMGNVFKILRNLAFIGAAFVIAGWAWGYITSGSVKLDDDKGGIKQRGIALIVGFLLLSTVGVVMQILGSSCTSVWG